jgi:hypothetical protein
VSDGRMFKQIVLTPEIINDHKKQAELDTLKMRQKLSHGSMSNMKGKRSVGVGRKKGKVGTISVFVYCWCCGALLLEVLGFQAGLSAV